MKHRARFRSTKQRTLGTALFTGLLGVTAAVCVLASNSGAATDQKVSTLADGPAAAIKLPFRAASTPTTAVAATTIVAPAPAPTSNDAPAITASPAPAATTAAVKVVAPQPAPEPAPAAEAPAPAVSPSGGGSAEDAIAAYFGDVYDKAVRVARCESGLDPGAVSPGGGNWGLFQINTVHRGMVESMGYSWDQILDPYVNADVARHIYDSSGWGPWGCRGA